MKKLWIILAALILAACSGQPKTDATEPQDAEAAIGAELVEVVLNVEGMTCDGCENAINAGVESLEGIAEVESSHEEAWTKVKFDKSVTSLEEVSEKISETGYNVVEEI